MRRHDTRHGASQPRRRRRAIRAEDIDARTATIYPADLADATAGRAKRALGNAFGLDQFGVNLTDLAPGAASALKHWHTHEDEFVLVLEGEVVLLIGDDEEILRAGECVGFKAGEPTGHAIVNRSGARARILEVGTRRPDVDEVRYPGLDLRLVPDGSGKRRFVRGDAEPA